MTSLELEAVVGDDHDDQTRQTHSARRSGASRLVSAVRKPGLLLSAAVWVVLLLWAVRPGWFTGHDPLATDSQVLFAGPSSQHLFGTDELGRDVYSRVVHGTSQTLLATFVAVVLGLVCGAAIGATAGFLRGRADSTLMRFVDVLLAIPALLLAMTVVTALGFGTTNIAIAVGIGAVASFARVTRAEVLRVSGTGYVEIARTLGTSRRKTLLRHVWPNAAGPVLALAALEVGQAILAVAALGYLGYGAPPPQPEWGLEVAQGTQYLSIYPWVPLAPGFVTLIAVLATYRISRAIGGRS
ncbi:ABC transporter permease [Gordonia sp. ABSL11-1]|uniref:ABC transporter permease n=1 Tax=Gordonia sp. ABSL11-1 TaxID=3053924 RepID=UPI002572D763|nr:ABC transporter permease [Gordonia sp. ABSL11-1]MDL9948121.1 ABC transporter permease [Gordonia sp. ABSL11-1]